MCRPRHAPMLGAALILAAPIVLAAMPSVSRAAHSILFESGIQSTPSTLPGHFNGPFGVATDDSGNVFVLERNGLRVQKFDSRGNFVTRWGSAGSGNSQFSTLSFIAVTNDHVFVTDSGNHRVQRFDKNGVYQMQWGSFGTGNGQFNNPYAIAIDSYGVLYITEWDGNRVQRFSEDGVYLGTWGSAGGGNGQFTNPSGIAVDHERRVYVADQTHRMQKFTHEGNHIATWGAFVFNTNGLAFDAVGHLYAASYTDKNLKKYSRDGALLETLGPSLGPYSFGNPIGVAVDPSGDVYVTFLDRHTVLKLSPVGDELSDAPPFHMMESSLGGLQNVSSIVGMAVDPATSKVYVADQANDRVLIVPCDGPFDPLVPCDPSRCLGSSGSGLGQLTTPTGLALATAGPSAGCLYVADSNNHRIQRYCGGGLWSAFGAFGTGNGQFRNPMGVAVDAAGNVYVVDYSNNRIQKFNSEGGYLTQWGSFGTLPGQFKSPMGIALDASGNVYVADGLNQRVQKFTGNGALMGQVRMTPNPGTGNGQFSLRVVAVAVDPSGDVYATDESGSRVQKFTQSGFYLTQWGSLGSAPGQFNNPKGLAFDPAGSAYVVDSPPLRIQKFASPPEITLLADVQEDNGGSLQLRFRRSSAEMAIGRGLYPTVGLLQYEVMRGSHAPVIVPPTGAAEYAVTLPTLADAGAGSYAPGDAWVVATIGQNLPLPVAIPHASAVEYGYSADQQPPPAPVNIGWGYVPLLGKMFTWQPNPAADFTENRFYSAPQEGLAPYVLLGTTTTNQFLTLPQTFVDKFAVTALDDHGNESAFTQIGYDFETYPIGVPAGPGIAFGLEGSQPNPTPARALKVRFSLADATPAWLELIDVTGRLTAAREVGALGAGAHVVDLSQAAPIRSGLYFLRLTQGPNSKTRRVTVLE